MAALLDEKITTYFLGNSAGLVQEAEKAKKAVTSLQKSLTQRVGAVKGSILDPGSLVGPGFEKIAATLTSKLKLGSGGSSALTGLTGSLAAGGAVLVKTFTAANSLAGANADKLASMSDSLRQASRVNMFASSVDGLDSLKEKYTNTQSLLRDAKQTQREVDPYGFGGGVGSNMKTALGNFQTATKSAVGLGPYSNFDREKDEAATLELRKHIAEQEARKLRVAFGDEQQNQLGLTRTRLTGSGSDVRLTELARDRQRELNGIKGTDLNTDDNRRAIEGRYGEQINAERENKRFTGRHNQRDTAVAGIEGSLVGDEQKRARIANTNLAFIREELRTRTYLTAEARQTMQVEELRAQNEARTASLALRRHTDEVSATQLDITSQREIVALGRQDIQARQQRAELDVRAAQAALSEAHGAEEYGKANERVKQAVAARVQLEKESAALTFRKYQDEVTSTRLSLANQRELVSLGQRGFEARKSLADLDVQSAQAAVSQANSTEEYAKANERLKQAVAARVDLEKTSVLTQRAAADLTFSLANRQADVNGTNASSLSKRAQNNQLSLTAMRGEYALPGTSDERRRELMLGIRGGENERREMLQERGFNKSPLQIQRALRKEANETRLRNRFDDKQAATDGLMNVSRDMNGRVTSGIDMLTGLRRAPVAHFSRPDDRSEVGNPATRIQAQQLEAQQAMRSGIDKMVQSFQRMEAIWVPLR